MLSGLSLVLSDHEIRAVAEKEKKAPEGKVPKKKKL
jgi:hypothetical protein